VSELQDAFAVNGFAVYRNQAGYVRKRLEYVEGFVCAVGCENVELCRFQYQLTSGKRLAGFCFRDDDRWTSTHARVDAMYAKKGGPM
jgi:hypothetical protein